MAIDVKKLREICTTRGEGFYAEISPLAVNELLDRLEAAEKREQALAAHVERLNEGIKRYGTRDSGFDIIDLIDIVNEAPETSLDRRDLLKQAEALEEVADIAEKTGLNAHPNVLRMKARDKRHQAEEKKP